MRASINQSDFKTIRKINNAEKYIWTYETPLKKKNPLLVVFTELPKRENHGSA